MNILALPSGPMIAGERLINCVVEGTLIALFISLLFRLKVFRDSATRFSIWLAALLAILVLPFIGSAGAAQLSGAASAPHLNVSAQFFVCAFAVWAAISLFGILRICVGL